MLQLQSNFTLDFTPEMSESNKWSLVVAPLLTPAINFPCYLLEELGETLPEY